MMEAHHPIGCKVVGDVRVLRREACELIHIKQWQRLLEDLLNAWCIYVFVVRTLG